MIPRKAGGRRLRGAIRLGLVLSLLVGPALGQDRLPVRLRVATRGPFHVAQEVALEVTTVAGGARPSLRLPEPAGATLVVVGQGMRPISTSAIGDVVNETIQYGWRLRLVPGRAGTLVVPPVRVEVDGRSGASAPLRIEVRTPPAAGRPAAFLGGVGPIQAHVEVRPAAVRVGEPAEVWLVLDGPGARGSTRPLSDLIGRLERLAVAPEVSHLPDEATDDPPRRVRRLRLRPTRTGEVTLPPVLVSWYDPAAGIYQGTLAAAVPLRVVEVPRLDPAAFTLAPDGRKAVRTILPWLAQGLGLVGLALAGSLLIWIRWRRSPASPRRAAIRLAQGLGASRGEEDAAGTAGQVTEALAAYLGLAIGRAGGVLTPPEAAEGFRRATGRDDLACEALALVDRCDRVRYDGHAEADGTASALREDAASLLRRVARKGSRGWLPWLPIRGRAGRGPARR